MKYLGSETLGVYSHVHISRWLLKYYWMGFVAQLGMKKVTGGSMDSFRGDEV